MMPIAIMMISDEDDHDFIKQLFLENEVVMFITANNIVKDYHIARDIVSESCVTMIKKIDYLRKIDVRKRNSYVISIVKNNSLMYLRKRKREIAVLAESQYIFADEISERSEDVDSKLIAEAEMQMVHEALSKIHKRDSELLKMKYFEKMSDAEIAEVMGIGTSSVRFYLTKAKRNLEKELKRREEE